MNEVANGTVVLFTDRRFQRNRLDGDAHRSRRAAIISFFTPKAIATRLAQVAGRFAAQDFVTLCYERPRRPGWRYNLFTMIHGREREAALAQIAGLAASAPDVRDHAILFSRRCFVQRGARLSAA